MSRFVFAAIGLAAVYLCAPPRLLAEPIVTASGDVPAAETAAGSALYDQHCAECHEHPAGRIPARSFISMLRTPESIINTLSKGVMRPMAKGLDATQIHNIAVFVTGREPGKDPQPDMHANMCKNDGGPIDLKAPGWNGWGNNPENTRYQADPGLKTEDVPKLKVKWAFAYPGIAYGQPVIVAGRVFIETREGQVFSLDAQTGCTHWAYDLGTAVRTAISIGALPGKPGKFAAYFGDEKGYAHAVDAMTGEELWATQVEAHPLARVTGAPKLFDGRLYVPVSSMEEVSGATPGLFLLHLPGQRRGARRRDRQDAVAELYDHAQAQADPQEPERYPDVRAGWRRDLGFADDRCQAPPALYRHRRFLHRHQGRRVGRGNGAGHGDRQARLAQPGA